MAAGALGTLPSLGGGGETTVAYRLWRIRLEAGAAYWVPQTEVPQGTKDSADFALISVIGRGGYTFTLGRFELVPTLLVEGAILRAEAQVGGNVTNSVPVLASWFEVGAGGWAFWSLTREIALRLGVEAAVPLTRPAFQITNLTSGPGVFQPGVIGAKGALGFEVRFL
jgi:hypothetical protein